MFVCLRRFVVKINFRNSRVGRRSARNVTFARRTRARSDGRHITERNSKMSPPRGGIVTDRSFHRGGPARLTIVSFSGVARAIRIYVPEIRCRGRVCTLCA